MEVPSGRWKTRKGKGNLETWSSQIGKVQMRHVGL